MAVGAIGRGHYITEGDEYTIAKDLVSGSSLAVGDEVALAADGKLAKGTTNPIGKIIKIYTWNGQDSIMIKFY